VIFLIIHKNETKTNLDFFNLDKMSRLGIQNRYGKPYTYKDMYKSYIKSLEGGENSPYYIPYSTYIKINNTYTNYIVNRVLEQSLPFKLGHRLGSFQIVKKKVYAGSQIKYESVDWEISRQLHKKVYHLNDHSGGFKYLFWWDRNNAAVVNIRAYKFIPVRTIKRKLAFNIKNKIRDYFEYKK
jgi:hypothetical protein